MLEGKLVLKSDLAQIVNPEGVVLADGALIVHPGHQSLESVGGQIASAVQFTGTLTLAGREAVRA